MPWYKNGLQNPHFIRDDGSVTWIADQPLGGFGFTGARAAVASGELVRYDEFITAVLGLKYKGTVKATTTGNITLSAPQTIDGISCVATDLVGVVAQTNPVQNGIYTVAAGAWTRATNLAAGMAAAGAYYQTEQGAVNAERFFVCTSDSGSDVVGTNTLAWSSWAGVTRHNSLLELQGGTTAQYYHLTSAQHTTLTGALGNSHTVETTAGGVLTSSAMGTAYNKAFGATAGDIAAIAAGGLSASQTVETDGASALVTAAKLTAYNVNFGDIAGTALVGNSARVPTGNALATNGAAVLAAALTAGRIPFADGATKLADDAGLTWDNTLKNLRVAGLLANVEHKSNAALIGTTTPIGSFANATSNGTATITAAAHGLSVAAGDLLHITDATTAADKGFYEVQSSTPGTIVVDRALAGSDADVDFTVYRDVIGFFDTDGTNGQIITAFSHQDKPLQLGGLQHVATAWGLTSRDVLIPGSVEIGGQAFFKYYSYFFYPTNFASSAVWNDNATLYIGTASDAVFSYQTVQTPDSLVLGVSADSNALVVCEIADITTDFLNPWQTDPTFIFQSADATKIYEGGYYNWNSITGKAIGAVAANGSDFTVTAQAGGTSGDRDGGRLILWGGAKGNAGADGYVSVGTGTPSFTPTPGSLFVSGIAELDAAVYAANLKSGINQGAAGAVAGELWVDTAAANVIKLGV